jgi:RNA polymerase sigma-70 factor, ECF subfamily
MKAEFQHIVAQHRDRVYNQAYRMLGNREDAEEAAQDVFLKVYRAGDTFRSESTAATWIYRITANVCIDRLRRKQVATMSMDAPIGDDGITLADTIKDPGPGPDAIHTDKETAGTVRRMVRDLPPDWAMALTLYHFDDRKYEEIAEIMELPVSTVGTYIRRGRQRLARELAAALTGDTQSASRNTGN